MLEDLIGSSRVLTVMGMREVIAYGGQSICCNEHISLAVMEIGS